MTDPLQPVACRAWFVPVSTSAKKSENNPCVSTRVAYCSIVSNEADTNQIKIMISVKIENAINDKLAAMPADKRPLAKGLAGQKIQSVAVAAKGMFEATTTNGHSVFVSLEEAKSW